MKTHLSVLAMSLTGLLLLSGCSPPQEDGLMVYSSRKEHLIKPLFERYQQRTGVKIRHLTGDAQPLMERLAAEGGADIFMTVDAGNLWTAAQRGLLQPVTSPALEGSIPARLRDPEGRWFGLSVRARTIAYSTERVQPGELSTYEALADPRWRGRLCLRTARKVYNQSLVATMIATLGIERTEEIVRGWVANLAVAPFSNDTSALKAVAAGQCDLTIVNTYYFGRLQEQQPDIAVALFWPNQAGRGVHVNISGAGIAATAPHPQAAQRFVEWLASEEAQGLYASLNKEYPANPKVAPIPQVAAWGDFVADQVPVAEAGRLQVEAVKLMDRAGYR